MSGSLDGGGSGSSKTRSTGTDDTDYSNWISEPKDHWWGDSIPGNITESIRSDTKFNPADSSKYSNTENNILGKVSMPSTLNQVSKNGELANSSDRAIIEMAAQIQKEGVKGQTANALKNSGFDQNEINWLEAFAKKHFR